MENPGPLTEERLTAIDLFSGPGGLTQGLKEAGFRVIGAVENAAIAANTYELNHDGVVFREDIQLLDPVATAASLMIAPGELDLLAGCPPCQGFSSTRTLNGSRVVQDERKDLVTVFGDWVEALRPRAVLMENVPGLAKDFRFSDLLARLAGFGYHVSSSAGVLNAADYGVPQNRKRLVMMGTLAGPVEFASCAHRATVRDAIGNLPKAGKSGDVIHDFPENRSATVKQIIETIPHDGGSRSALSENLILPCHKRSDGFKDVYGRMAWDRPAPTITGGCFNPSKGRFLHPVENRNITMREAALLQGFPASYKFDCSRGKTAVAQMIGNAIPPPFVSSHALVLKAALTSESRLNRQW